MGLMSVGSPQNKIGYATVSWSSNTNQTNTIDVGKKIKDVPIGDIFRLTYQGTVLTVIGFEGSVITYKAVGSNMTGKGIIPYLY